MIKKKKKKHIIYHLRVLSFLSNKLKTQLGSHSVLWKAKLGTVWYANILLPIILKYKSYVPSQILLSTSSFSCLGQHFTYMKSVLHISYLEEILHFEAWNLIFWVATEMQPRSEIIIEVNLDQGEEDMGRGQGENVPLLSLFLMVYFELKFLVSIFPEKSKTLSEQWLIMSPLWFFIVKSKATHVFASLLLFPYLHCLRLLLPKYSVSPAENCEGSHLACELRSEPTTVTQMLREDMRSSVGHKRLYHHSRQRELYGYMLPLPTKSHAGTLHTVYLWHSWEKASLENPSILKGLPGTLPHIFPTWEYYFTQFSSVAQSCLTLWDPKDCSKPGFPVHHKLPELTQTQVYWVGDAIQPSYSVVPFSSGLLSFPASGSFQICRFFASGGQSIGSFSFQHQSFQWIFRTDFL